MMTSLVGLITREPKTAIKNVSFLERKQSSQYLKKESYFCSVDVSMLSFTFVFFE